MLIIYDNRIKLLIILTAFYMACIMITITKTENITLVAILDPL